MAELPGAVLFSCTRNSVRSPMAEGLLKHLLGHKVPILWEFHKVHHSVEQMGFAAHLR